MADLIRMASHAHHYLAVFDSTPAKPSTSAAPNAAPPPAQRIVLYAKDRGCTRPGCTAPAYRCQVHHAVADWNHGGHTNINDLTLACGPDNRLVENTGWTTRSATTAAPNGSHHPTSTPAKPASTTTTTPNACSTERRRRRRLRRVRRAGQEPEH